LELSSGNGTLTESRVYLVSAYLKYGNYNVTAGGGTFPIIHKGDPCLIVNATFRNDYTPEQPPPQTYLTHSASDGSACFFVTAQLFLKNGNQISAPNVTPPYPLLPFGAPQYCLKSNSEFSVELYFSTNHKNIDHYDLILLYIGSVPVG
jgi:hypothetical protein